MAVLGLAYLGTFGPAAANASASPQDDSPSWARMSVSVDPTVSAPAASQTPYDARITLDYVIRNTGEVPIYRVRLEDPLVSGESVNCDGSEVVEILPAGSSVDCEATVELPPGTYSSGPRARGWVSVLLILGFPVSAGAQATFSVAAPPPPPSSPPPSPPASPTPSAPARPPAPPPATSPAAAAPSSVAPVPTTPAASKSPAASPSRTPAPVPTSSRPHALALPPPRPTAQVHQLSPHVAVLLLLLPAAVGAAVAGAAAARRR